VERRVGHHRIRNDVVLDNAETNAGPEDITKLAKPNIHLSSSDTYLNQS
jgi:hypothetical protein